MKMMYSLSRVTKETGFTLIEVMVVLAIIATLLTFSIPSSQGKMEKVRIRESIKLITPYKEAIAAHYAISGEFPKTNKQAGLPEPSLIAGNYLSSVTVQSGGMDLTLGNKINKNLVGKVITIRPIFVPESPLSPISWICGYDTIPENMLSPALNNTDIKKQLLPLECL